ncbi:MAG: MoaD/ThiS family protein [Spirochaetales bacterium]
MTVTVRYYGRLQEEAGLAQETLETSATTLEGLWSDVAERHPFTLDIKLIKAAQADEFCPWKAKLVPGALVVFMPPVAGG